MKMLISVFCTLLITTSAFADKSGALISTLDARMFNIVAQTMPCLAQEHVSIDGKQVSFSGAYPSLERSNVFYLLFNVNTGSNVSLLTIETIENQTCSIVSR